MQVSLILVTPGHGRGAADSDPVRNPCCGPPPQSQRRPHQRPQPAGRRRSPGFLAGILLVVVFRGGPGLVPGQRLDTAGRGLRRVPPPRVPAGTGPRLGAGRHPDPVRPFRGHGGDARGLPAHGPLQGAGPAGEPAQARASQRGNPGSHGDQRAVGRPDHRCRGDRTGLCDPRVWVPCCSTPWATATSSPSSPW